MKVALLLFLSLAFGYSSGQTSTNTDTLIPYDEIIDYYEQDNLVEFEGQSKNLAENGMRVLDTFARVAEKYGFVVTVQSFYKTGDKRRAKRQMKTACRYLRKNTSGKVFIKQRLGIAGKARRPFVQIRLSKF